MGDPKKPRRRYESPRQPWQADVLAEELKLLGLFGLRNKRELWKHKTELTKYRNIARSLLGMPPEKRAKMEEELLSKLYKLGLIEKGGTVEDVLDLVVENILERRLQTVVFRQGLAKSLHQARQFITHGHIQVGEKKVTAPSYMVRRDEEGQLSFSPDSPFREEEHPVRKTLGQ
ncbi:30S ribosomal protein S4 [Candidatus Hecatella orcuttiae]|jgi:small subunit ribosomal protein S4|uniref:30S ribosomal protein S4 n=1 Tax=Candidatus Hecatella orcuttiae TaxID=1935119 RepID=UPI002867F21A|nr:30S ribosomal protein S4 [Candidatus Hecatella orcuttiae]